MSRTAIVFVVVLVVIAIVGGTFWSNQVHDQRVVALNQRKQALSDDLASIFASEAKLRIDVVMLDYQYDLCITAVVPVQQNPSTAQPLPTFTIGTPGAAGAIILTDPRTGKVCKITSDFQSNYQNYASSVYAYNTKAASINSEAAKLGEPEVVLLQPFEPSLR